MALWPGHGKSVVSRLLQRWRTLRNEARSWIQQIRKTHITFQSCFSGKVDYLLLACSLFIPWPFPRGPGAREMASSSGSATTCVILSKSCMPGLAQEDICLNKTKRTLLFLATPKSPQSPGSTGHTLENADIEPEFQSSEEPKNFIQFPYLTNE